MSKRIEMGPPTWERPSEDPVGSWIESSGVFTAGDVSAEVVNGRFWSVGFDFRLVLRNQSATLDPQRLTAYYYTPWDEPPRDAVRIDVHYARPGATEAVPRTPRIALCGTGSGVNWLRADFWVSPRPEPTDQVVITVRLDSADLNWTTKWAGLAFNL